MKNFPKQLLVSVLMAVALVVTMPRFAHAQANQLPAVNSAATVNATDDDKDKEKECEDKPGKDCPPTDVPEISYPVLFLLLGGAVIVGGVIGAAIKHLVTSSPRRKK